MTTPNPSEDARRRREAALQQRIGANIRAAQLARAVSQEELAAALKIERPSLSRYERGERSIPLTILLDIAAILDTSVERLIQADREVEQPALPLHMADEKPVLVQHRSRVP